MRSRWLVSRQVRGVIAVLVISGLVPVATAGCFGNFALTRKVYGYNKEVSPDKWVRWLVFLVLNVVPVYGFAALFDAVFANSIEFWTGQNPVVWAPGTERVVHGPAGDVARLIVRAPGVADLEIAGADGRVHAMTLVREDSTVAAYDAAGRFLMRVGDVEGAPAVVARASN